MLKRIDLLPYQLTYLSHVKPNFVYDCDTGVGKTYMGLYHWRKFYPTKPLLIVAPASKINEGGWQRTIDEFLGDVKYEAISYNKLSKQWKKYTDYFVIFDECHRLKNSTGVWGRSGFMLTKIASGFVLLSATPTPNGWEDMINYFKMFKLTANKTQFLKKHAVTSRANGYPEILGWQLTDQLETAWAGISRRLDKKDALELPDLTFTDVLFKKSKDYTVIATDRILNEVPYDNQMKLRHGLRLNTALIAKTAYLTEFLESTTDNVIVFYNYDEELEQLKHAVGKKTMYEVNGHVQNYPKKPEWSGVRNSVTLANYKSGSEAVELTYGTVIVYFSPTDSYTEYYQSYGRSHRNGQTQKVSAYRFITQGTIERDIYRALNQKKDFNIQLWENENL